MADLHDWTLLGLTVDWKTGTLILDINWGGRSQNLTAFGLSELRLPRQHSWGPSVSINKCGALIDLGNGRRQLLIEMQSSDTIEIVAQRFEIPS